MGDGRCASTLRRCVIGLLAVLLAACSTAPPASLDTDPSGPPPVGTAPAPAGSSAGPAAASAEEITALAEEGLRQPVALADGTGDLAVRALAGLGGITDLLGGDAHAVLLDLAAAERASVRDMLAGLGIEPGALPALEPAAGVAAPPATARLAAQTDAELVSMLALAAFIAAGEARIPGTAPDAKGNVSATFSSTSTTTSRGLAITLVESITIDLARCPDASGMADGDVDYALQLDAAGELDGRPVAVTAGGTIHARLGATADDRAALVEAWSTSDGNLEVTQGDATGGSTTWRGAGGSMPVSGGRPDPQGATWRDPALTGDPSAGGGFEGYVRAAVAMLSMIHATAAERHWTAGSCIRIDTTPASPARARDDRTLDLQVKAVAAVDDSAVKGELRITPASGTFTPSRLSLPGSVKAVVPSGAKSASADLELRSKRGIGRRTIQVLARADVLWYLEFTHVAETVLPDDVGKGEGDASFFLDIRADPSLATSPGTKAKPATVPLVFERTSFIWSGKAWALGESQSFSGSVGELSTLDYSDPLWMVQLPETDFVTADGWLDLTNRELYLFVAGVGDKSGAGTFNLGPQTDCTFHRAKRTNKVYLVFDVREDWTISPGSCEDEIPYKSSSGNGILTRGVRTWTWDLESDIRTYVAGG